MPAKAWDSFMDLRHVLNYGCLEESVESTCNSSTVMTCVGSSFQ